MANNHQCRAAGRREAIFICGKGKDAILVAPVPRRMSVLTRQKSTLFQWLAVPLWVPTGKDSVPTDSGGIPFTILRSRNLYHSPYRDPERRTRFSSSTEAGPH